VPPHGGPRARQTNRGGGGPSHRLHRSGAGEAGTGDASGALDAIEKAREVAPSPNVHHLFHPLAPHWARVWLVQGDVAAAARWVQERGLSVNDELSYLHEVEHIVLARVLIAQDKPDEALRLLERLLSAAQKPEEEWQA
jgi:LuxR family maltose regulon positive regulatory protein